MARQHLYPLPPNRVRRNYRGGAMLAPWDGHGKPVDGECPEDWIASTVEARNPGLPPVDHEGLSNVLTADGPRPLPEVIADDPGFMLGTAHLKKFGPHVGFLTKLLDAGMRLHIQAHPTAAFARQHLDSRWGKMEAYLILSVREGCEGSLLLGFQHDPGPEAWRRIVMEQDKEAMLACFEPIPVTPGELWFVPGGVPHAIGQGLLVVEIMEPTDLVVRCEFERDGLVVPPAARFMGRDPEFALQIFHHESWSPSQVRERLHVEPEPIATEDGVVHEQLFGLAQSECFTVQRVRLDPNRAYEFDADGRLAVALIVDDGGRVTAGPETLALRKGDRYLAAAATGPVTFAGGAAGMEAVICMPQLRDRSDVG